MKVSNANTKPLDGKDFKILDSIHSLEKTSASPRHFQTIHDIENFKIFSTMDSVLYRYYSFDNHDVSIFLMYQIFIYYVSLTMKLISSFLNMDSTEYRYQYFCFLSWEWFTHEFKNETSFPQKVSHFWF